MSKIEFIPDTKSHLAAAVRIATSTEPLNGLPESQLIMAARYCGKGWSQARRKQIIAYLRPLLAAQ